MKILFVIANIANGGAERVLSALSSEFAKENEIHIAVLEKNFELYKFDPNIKFHALKIYNGSKFVVKFKKIIELRRLFKTIKPDLIISFIDWTNVACVVANFGLKFKHIATEHNSNEHLKSPKFRLIRDICYRFVDGLSVLGKSDFKYYSFVKNKAILHNPIFISQGVGTPKCNIILSVGRLETVKGYDIYFNALAKVDKNLLQNWRICIAGTGSLKSELKELAKKLSLNIEFLGHVSDVSPLYESAKIFVITSISEGLSNVLIESGYFGCARVSSDTVGARELIQNRTDGLLFKNGDTNELAKILNEILNNENLLQELGTNAKANSSKFELKNIMQKWQKFIDGVMKK